MSESVTVLAPTSEPVSLADALEHIRQDVDNVEATLLQAQITAARHWVEDYIQQDLVRRTWRTHYRGFPHVIELPHGPVRSVTSITYVDDNGSTQTLSASQYQVNTEAERTLIAPAYGTQWPTTRLEIWHAVTVEYVTGYAVPFTTNFSSDANLLEATAQPFAADDTLQVWASGGALPDGLSAMANYYVVNPVTNGFELSATSGGSPVTLTSDQEGDVFAGRIPEPILAATKIMIGELYENREDSIIGTSIVSVPNGIRALLSSHIVQRF